MTKETVNGMLTLAPQLLNINQQIGTGKVSKSKIAHSKNKENPHNSKGTNYAFNIITKPIPIAEVIDIAEHITTGKGQLTGEMQCKEGFNMLQGKWLEGIHYALVV